MIGDCCFLASLLDFVQSANTDCHVSDLAKAKKPVSSQDESLLATHYSRLSGKRVSECMNLTKYTCLANLSVNNSGSIPRFITIAFTSEIKRTGVRLNVFIGTQVQFEFRKQCSHYLNKINSDGK